MSPIPWLVRPGQTGPLSETVKLEPGPVIIGEPMEFYTAADLLADAIAKAHVEVGAEAGACAKFVLGVLDSQGFALGPKALQPYRQPEPLPDFRTFYAAKNGPAWPCATGATLDTLHRQLADTLADYADEIRKRSA